MPWSTFASMNSHFGFTAGSHLQYKNIWKVVQISTFNHSTAVVFFVTEL